MGIGASIFLVALGAVLAFAVEVDVAGLDITAVGWILMIVGVVGGVLAATTMAPWRSRRETVVDEAPPREREIIRER